MFSKSQERYDVFLSYTRYDSGGWAGRVHDRLEGHLQLHGWSVFKDDIYTDPGEKKWSDRLERLVAECKVFIPIIGDQWHAEHVQHLFDEQNWVRREILKALETSENKIIIPLVLNGKRLPRMEALPDDIVPIFDDQACFLSGDSRKLNREIEDLAGKIMDKPAKALCDDKRLDREFAPLNRHWEEEQIFKAYSDDASRVFAVAADDADCYESFMHRCENELSLICSSGQSQVLTEPHWLKWREYSVGGDKTRRREQLIQAISESLGIGNDQSAMQRFFSENRQPTVFYSVCDNVGTGERCSEWLRLWKELLELSDQRTTIAILIFNRGWPLRQHRRKILQHAELSDHHTLDQGLGPIAMRDAEDFQQDRLGHISRDAFAEKLKSAYRWPVPFQKLKCFRPRCKSVRRALEPLLD